MNESNKSGMGFKILGFLILLMGLIHEFYTGEVWKMLVNTDPMIAWTFLYMYLSTGLAVILCGFLLLFMASQLKKGQPLAKFLSLSICAFLTLLGIGGVIIMPTNPFAWLMLILAGFNVILILQYRSHFV